MHCDSGWARDQSVENSSPGSRDRALQANRREASIEHEEGWGKTIWRYRGAESSAQPRPASSTRIPKQHRATAPGFNR
eukprot:1742389-Pyramimonas_sp.AAC.1